MFRRTAIAVAACLVALAIPAAGAGTAQAATAIVWGGASAPMCPTSAGVIAREFTTAYTDGTIRVVASVRVSLQLDDNTVPTAKVTETVSATARTLGPNFVFGLMSGTGTIGLGGSTVLSAAKITAPTGPHAAAITAALVRVRASAFAQAVTLRLSLRQRVANNVQKPGRCLTAFYNPAQNYSTPRANGSTQARVRASTGAIVPGTWVLQSNKFGHVTPLAPKQQYPNVNWTSAATADPATDELVEATYLVKSRAGRVSTTLKVMALRQVKVQATVDMDAKLPADGGIGGWSFHGDTSFVAAQEMSLLGKPLLNYYVKSNAQWALTNGVVLPPAGCDTATLTSLLSTGTPDIVAGDDGRVTSPTMAAWDVDVMLIFNLFAKVAGPVNTCPNTDVAALNVRLTEPRAVAGSPVPLEFDVLRQSYPYSRIGVPVTRTFSVDLSRLNQGLTGTMLVHMTLTPQPHS